MADQDARAVIADWMIARSYPTGHGDTVDALLSELVACVREEESESIRAYTREHGFDG
jgi:hypothetical protein